MPYASQKDLENALGVALVTSIFDDDLDGQADEEPLAACIAAADADVNSVLRNAYPAAFPMSGTIPDEIKFAAVDFMCAYATRRRPDIVKAMGEQPWVEFRKAANERIKNYAMATTRLPPTVGVPKNVGGVIFDDGRRVMTPGADGTSNSGDF